jgi:monomeric sarcosine oxidase
MKLRRREFVQSLTTGIASVPALRAVERKLRSRFIKSNEIYDVAVIGAGVFGVWTAYHLQRAGRSVVLLDAYGPANNRASSGGESRVIRISYGKDEIYSRFSLRSLSLWQDLSKRNCGLPLFHRTGVLWMAREPDAATLGSLEILKKLNVEHEKISRAGLEKRYPQVSFDQISLAILEPNSGALMARRAVQTVFQEVLEGGAQYLPESVSPPAGKVGLDRVVTGRGTTVRAKTFVFASGPWLPKLFPDVLGGRILPTRQEVFYFGVPAGDRRFSPPALPVWADLGGGLYGLPDLENRGFKIAFDRHGPEFDPDTGIRLASSEGLAEMRRYLARRFPDLKDAPVVETRVCQYENTSNGDFLIDRHPELENVWLVGGGSGHGFKHGPAVGEYVAARITKRDEVVEPRFALATKGTVQKRTVY